MPKLKSVCRVDAGDERPIAPREEAILCGRLGRANGETGPQSHEFTYYYVIDGKVGLKVSCFTLF